MSLNSDFDYLTICYSGAGAQQWLQTYNSSYDSTDQATAITLDGAGNIYVTGSSFDSLTGNDITTIKYSGSGTQQWTETLNSVNNFSDIPGTVAVDPFGNTYVSGTAQSQYVTVKY